LSSDEETNGSRSSGGDEGGLAQVLSGHTEIVLGVAVAPQGALAARMRAKKAESRGPSDTLVERSNERTSEAAP